MGTEQSVARGAGGSVERQDGAGARGRRNCHQRGRRGSGEPGAEAWACGGLGGRGIRLQLRQQFAQDGQFGRRRAGQRGGVLSDSGQGLQQQRQASRLALTVAVGIPVSGQTAIKGSVRAISPRRPDISRSARGLPQPQLQRRGTRTAKKHRSNSSNAWSSPAGARSASAPNRSASR